MARFVRHESCPRCGSRDNLGRYDDGSGFCFGCHYTEKPDLFQFNPNRSGTDGKNQATLDGRVHSDIPTSVSESLRQLYGITVRQLLGANAWWDADREQLCFPYRDKDGELVCVQRRNYNPYRASKAKYLNEGETYEVFDLIVGGSSSFPRTVVITEDKLSAMKVSNVCDAIPALGTTFQTHKLIELMKRGYQTIVVWLDSDKWREAREISDQCKWVGLSSKTVLTPLDPKEYDNTQIVEYLK
jgi:hypothetical protein